MNAITTVESDALLRASASAAAKGERLTFRLATEEYGIDILRVQEIRGYEQPTRIANAPPFLKGVLNLRGVIVPIVDLRLKFGVDPVDDGGTTVTVVLNVGGRTVGAVVDSVSDVIQLTDEQVKPAPEFGSAVDAAYIVGIGAIRQGEQERMLVLVDIEKLMTSPDMGLGQHASH